MPYCLTAHIDQPTRITESSASCLDQIITNIPNFVRNTSVLTPLANCDHCPISANLLFRRKKSPAFSRSIWDYSKANYDVFRSKLSESNWDYCFESCDINVACTRWTDTLLTAAREAIPHKDITVRPDDVPWYTNLLRCAKRKVERIHKRAKKKPSLWPYFRQLRNKYIDDLRHAEENYYGKLEETINQNTGQKNKSWWHTVKFFLHKNQSSEIPALFHDNTTFTDNETKAQILNDFFISQCSVDDSNYSPSDIFDNDLPPLQHVSTTEGEVQILLLNLDISKAIGPDGISPRLLKEGAPIIAKSLSRLFNLSLTCNTFPSEWKKANVIPVFKHGCTSLCCNYRPISLLSCVSKVFERVIFKHVFNYFRDNSTISECQSGFIPGDSTVNQLIFLYHKFCEALDRQKDVRVIFCDITRAFDRVYHPGLLHKLEKVGVRGSLLLWFKDYLNDRKQRVVIQGSESSWGSVRAGVPQGSVLGPLLFLIFINDIVNIVQSPIRLFADDTTLFIQVDNPTLATDLLNIDLQEMANWSHKWLVTFNPNKTKSMIISKKRVPLNYPDLTFMDETVENVTEHKHLGLLIRSDLTWKSHIDGLVNKSMKMVNILKFLQYRLSRKSLEILYLSFIRPTLEYGSIIWDGCTSIQSKQLENVQLAAARVITGATRGTSHNLIYDEVGLETLSERRRKAKLIHFYKIVYGDAPQYLRNLVPEPTSQRLKSRGIFPEIPTSRDYFRSSFFPSVIGLWNELPIDTRKAESCEEFRAKLNRNAKVKCNKLFYVGDRRLSVAHARIRMQCSNLNSHLFRKGLVASPVCACGSANEDAFHYFCECNKYITHRDVLQRKVLGFASFTVQTLLFGSNKCTFKENEMIFQAVHQYINDTGRLGFVT